jgi:hypothetical protein
METKTTPVHPLLVGTTPGPWTTRLLPTPGGFTVETNREYAGDRWWIADMGDSGHIGTEEREANAKLIAQAPSLAAENALLAEQVERLREALRKCVSGFDDLVNDSHGVYGLHLKGDPSPWGELTEGGRFEEWTQWHTEARDLLSKYKTE